MKTCQVWDGIWKGIAYRRDGNELDIFNNIKILSRFYKESIIPFNHSLTMPLNHVLIIFSI